MATNEGLSPASDLACNTAVIATACSATVSHMKEGYLGNLAAIIHEIKSMQLFASVEVVHENISMNVEAHYWQGRRQLYLVIDMSC